MIEISSAVVTGLLLTALVGVLGFLIKGLISGIRDDLKGLEIKHVSIESKCNDNQADIRVLKNNHSNLENKIDKIGEGVHEINTWIRNLKQN